MTELKPGERWDRLMREDLDIIQSADHFAFSIDALLLADFAQTKASARSVTVDFCTGNGVLPLVLAQRTQGKVYGIEWQEDVADMAQRSVCHNHLEDQVQIIQGNIRRARDYFAHDSVDLITCNPPYFKVYPQSPLNPNDSKAVARHELLMTAEDIFQRAKILLKSRGKLYLVHQVERLPELLLLADKHRLQLKRLRLVYPLPGREAHIVLLEFIKNGQAKGLRAEPPLYIHDQEGHYSKEVAAVLYG